MKKTATITSGMKATFLALVALCYFAHGANAQATLPVDKNTQKVSYRFRIPVSSKFTKAAAFEMVQQWMQQNPTCLTRCNSNFTAAAAANNGTRGFSELETAFNNQQPLQSIDPEGNRIAARVMVKYCGGKESRCMQMMYVQYYMVITLVDGAMDVELTDFRYNHFNKKTCQLQRINSWADYTSCDPISTIEYLMANENCHTDFNAFVDFLNSDVAKLQTKLNNHFNDAQAVSMK